LRLQCPALSDSFFSVPVASKVHFTSKVCTKYLPQFPRVARFAPAVVALSMIPFVIHPIDHGTDWVFDRTVRQWYSDKLKLPSGVPAPHAHAHLHEQYKH
jgi:hypothetical protein